MSLSRKSDGKVLVLVVDIDDDLGREGFSTPVIGYENVLKIATEFGIRKPSDSDLNALFSALNIYKRLVEEGWNVEIAVLTGDSNNLFKASLKINNFLEALKKTMDFKYIYFISDGVHDERIMPIIENHGKILGIERVIVEQSRSIEETYILLSKYIRKALTEQPYTRFSLGIPGLILLLYAITSLMGFSSYVWETTSLIIGLLLFVKGFGLFDQIIEHWKTSPIIGVLSATAMVLLLYVVFIDLLIIYFYGASVKSLKLLINMSMLPLVLGIASLFSSRIFYKVVKGYPQKIWRDTIYMIPLIFFIVFVNNFNRELSRMGENTSIEQVFKLLEAQHIYLPLLLAIIFTVFLTFFFIVLDILIVKKRLG